MYFQYIFYPSEKEIQCLAPNVTDKVHRQRNIQSIFGIVKIMFSAVGWNTSFLWFWHIESILNEHFRALYLKKIIKCEI